MHYQDASNEMRKRDRQILTLYTKSRLYREQEREEEEQEYSGNGWVGGHQLQGRGTTRTTTAMERLKMWLITCLHSDTTLIKQSN